MKQLELSFSKTLEVETEKESKDEHARRMEKQPHKLHDETDTPSICQENWKDEQEGNIGASKQEQ